MMYIELSMRSALKDIYLHFLSVLFTRRISNNAVSGNTLANNFIHDAMCAT